MNKENKTVDFHLRIAPSEKAELLEAGRKLGGMSRLVRLVCVPAAKILTETKGEYCTWPKMS